MSPLPIIIAPFGNSTPYAEPLWYSRDVSHYRDSHRQLRAAVRSYIDEEILPHAFEWETCGQVPDSAYKRHCRLGYIGASVGALNYSVKLPGDIPALEWDAFHTLILNDEISRCAYTGVVWGLGGGNSIGVPPIVNYGTSTQKAKFLPGVVDGSIRFCLGITESDAGSDVAGIKTTAKLNISKTHFIVNGSKKWITNGVWADFCTAAVRTGGSGATGISLLIIPLKNSGVKTRLMANSGVAASGSTFITFEDVEVPVENLIHKMNCGFEVMMSNFNTERKSLATQAIRLSRVCVEDAWAHACTRKTFGKKLIQNPMIRGKFMRMGRMIEPAQAFQEQLTWLIELSRRRQGAAAEVRIGGMTAMLKVVATRCLEKCVREAQQILGGLGYTRGGKGGRIEAISRDLRALCVGGGSEEIMSELAIREETKDLLLHSKLAAQSKL